MGLGLKDIDEKPHHELHIYRPADEQGLYDDLEDASVFSRSLSSSLGLPLPNPAPDIDIAVKLQGNSLFWIEIH